MKVTSIIKIVILFAIFYYIITFINANQESQTIYFPWIGEPLGIGGPGWSIIGICLAIGFLTSAFWMLSKTVVSFFSRSGRLSRSMKKVEEKYYYGIEALSKGDKKAAGVFFEEILTIDPENFRTLIKYGELHREMGNVQRAISLHQQALSLSHNNVKVLHELSLDYLSASELTKAREVLEKIIEISPKGNLAVHRQLRDLLIAEQDWEKALHVQDTILAQVSDSSEKLREQNLHCGIEYRHAGSFKDKGKFQQAAEIYEGIVAKTPTFLPAHLELGECYLSQNDDEKAIMIWKQGFEVTQSPVLLSRLEDYYLGIEKPDKAIETYSKVMAKSSEDLLPRLLLGKLFYRLEMLDRALAIFEEIDSEFEYAPVMFYFMGKIQARRGDMKEAAETFRNVIRSSGLLEAEFICDNCRTTFNEYIPQCSNCGEWNRINLNVQKGKTIQEMEVSTRPMYA